MWRRNSTAGGTSWHDSCGRQVRDVRRMEVGPVKAAETPRNRASSASGLETTSVLLAVRSRCRNYRLRAVCPGTAVRVVRGMERNRRSFAPIPTTKDAGFRRPESLVPLASVAQTARAPNGRRIERVTRWPGYSPCWSWTSRQRGARAPSAPRTASRSSSNPYGFCRNAATPRPTKRRLSSCAL